LGDPRRKERLLSVAYACMVSPGKSFGQSLPHPAQVKGAYRLMANEQIPASALSDSLCRAGIDAVSRHDVIYAIQDTTTVEFNRRAPIEGLGPIGTATAPGQGFFLHTTLAVRPDGLPLGYLNLQTWARDPRQTGTRYHRKERPVEEKESFKWIRAIRESSRLVKQKLPAAERPRLIFIGDRECDIHEVFEEVMPTPHGLIVRAAWNRRIADEAGHIWEHLRQLPVYGHLPLEISANARRKARTARLAVRWSRVLLTPSPAAHPHRVPVSLYVVWVQETEPPAGESPIEWMLLTTEPVLTLEEALQIIEAYRLRWRIEELHLILKSGCRLESVQYDSLDRLEKILMLGLGSALRLLLLRYVAETHPSAPCTQVLSPIQEQALCVYVTHHFKTPVTHLTVAEALLWIGRLGGFLGRKRDGRPGVRPLWRGWRDLEVLASMYEAMNRS
jgi:hypothetical protein